MSRETVLALLRAGGETYLSGEELSRQLGLSRAAVWPAGGLRGGGPHGTGLPPGHGAGCHD